MNNLLNTKILEELWSLDDPKNPAFLPETFVIFRNNLTKSVGELHIALAEGNWAKVEHWAHHAKGMCLNMGAQALSSEFQTIELATRNGVKPANPIALDANQLNARMETTFQAQEAWLQAAIAAA